MSLISSATALPQSFSPLQRLQSELASEVSSGTISASDQSALSAALTDINSAMQSGAAAASGSRPSPADMKAKISSLIAGEVSDGKLTSDQAAELNNIFAQAFQGGPGGGPGGAGAAGGGGGNGCASDAASSDPADTNGDGVVSAAEQAVYDAKHPGVADATSSDASGSSSTKSDASKLLADFLKLLQDSKTGSSSYSAGGDSLTSAIQSLIVNYQA